MQDVAQQDGADFAGSVYTLRRVEEFLTVDEIAHALKPNPQTARNYIERGELPSVRIGGRRVRVRKADLEAFVGTETDLSQPSLDHTPEPPAGSSEPTASLHDGELIAALRAFGLADALDRQG